MTKEELLSEIYDKLAQISSISKFLTTKEQFIAMYANTKSNQELTRLYNTINSIYQNATNKNDIK